MCAVFFLQYLDKQSLSYASVSFRISHCAHQAPIDGDMLSLAGIWPHYRSEYDKPPVLMVQLDLLRG